MVHIHFWSRIDFVTSWEFVKQNETRVNLYFRNVPLGFRIRIKLYIMVQGCRMTRNNLASLKFPCFDFRSNLLGKLLGLRLRQQNHSCGFYCCLVKRNSAITFCMLCHLNDQAICKIRFAGFINPDSLPYHFSMIHHKLFGSKKCLQDIR